MSLSIPNLPALLKVGGWNDTGDNATAVSRGALFNFISRYGRENGWDARGACRKKKVTAEPIGDLFSILRFVYVYYEALSQLNRQLEARLIRSRNKFEPPTFFCARRDSNRLLDPPLRQFVSFYFETNEIAGEMKKKRLRIIHPLIEIWPKRNRHCKKDKGNRKTLMSPRIFRVLLVCLQLYCLILSRGKSATMKRVFSRRVESSNPTGSFNIQ